nr:hypothetical protein [Streptomyces sp. SID4926]
MDPDAKQTQVYVQIPDVARATWLLNADFYSVLKSASWPHVIDTAHAEYERRGVVSDPTSTAARQAIVDWLLLSEGAEFDARYDAVYAAWEADEARRHPVAQKLLAENEQLRARVAELTAAPAEAQDEPVLVTSFTSATDEEPGRVIHALTEKGEFVAVLLDEAARARVHEWTAPTLRPSVPRSVRLDRHGTHLTVRWIEDGKRRSRSRLSRAEADELRRFLAARAAAARAGERW